MIKKIISDITNSKSVYDFEETNDLLFCNMNTHEARKATCEISKSKCNSNRPQSVKPARQNVLK